MDVAILYIFSLFVVIAALDELKKFNPGARDAIKFLEDEIKHGNRCVTYELLHWSLLIFSQVGKYEEGSKYVYFEKRRRSQWKFHKILRSNIFPFFDPPPR